MSKRRAFTLIELLVVIAIFAILAALATSAITGTLAKGRETKCASNLRQIGAGLILFAADHDGDLPETTHSNGAQFRRAWIFTLKPYLADCDEVRISPADPLGAQRLAENGTSYVLNSWVFVPQYGPFGEVEARFDNLRRLPLPTHTMLAFNVSDQQPASVLNDHTHCDLWPGNWSRVCAEIQPDRHRTGASGKGHLNGASNILYADGHVAAMEASDLHKLVMSQVPVGKPPMETEDILQP
ncbi:MAG: type II secretion system protein [Chthoniobacteraceae bacterium]